MTIKILTDSTSDFTSEKAKALGVDIIPLSINFGDKEYIEGVDITVNEFYKKLREAEAPPTTSQVSTGAFKEKFENTLKEYDELIYISISGNLSGTHQSSVLAKSMLSEEEQKRVHLIDSKSVTIGLSLLVTEAVKLKDAGKTSKEIVEKIENLKEKIVILAFIDELTYLKRGGRLSSSSASIGTMLNIKPIIGVIDGKVEVVHKARGKNKGYNYIKKEIESLGFDSEKGIVAGHADWAEEYKDFHKFITDIFKGSEIQGANIGPVVGTHAGPQALGVAFIKN